MWVEKNGARERHVNRVTRLVTDARATHFWDEHGAVVRALDALLGIPGRACAGAFLVYPPDVRWDGALPPEPAYWADAHAREFEDHGPAFNADRFREAVQASLP